MKLSFEPNCFLTMDALKISTHKNLASSNTKISTRIHRVSSGCRNAVTSRPSQAETLQIVPCPYQLHGKQVETKKIRR
jgi:hypothetical protein